MFYGYEGGVIMNEKRIHYGNVRDQVEILFESEKVVVCNEFIENFLNILSRLCNYEEEGKKIRPRVVISNNINDAMKTVANSYIVKTRSGNLDGSDMEKIIKSLIPFCSNGWHVFIDIKEKDIQYGVIRSFSGPIGLSFTQNLFNVQDFDLIEYGILEIQVLSNFEFNICGLRKNSLTVDFRLLEHNEDKSNLFPRMIEDITSNISDSSYIDALNKAFNNLFQVLPYKVHGTICLVVDKDYEFPNEFLSDGIWFDEPIDLGSKIIDTAINTKDIISSEAYYGLSGLFMEMLNVDGITIVDNMARVRGFNVFVRKTPHDVEIPAEGGARKRAANTVLATRDPKVKGVYFLSQDGNSFYKRIGD